MTDRVDPLAMMRDMVDEPSYAECRAEIVRLRAELDRFKAQLMSQASRTKEIFDGQCVKHGVTWIGYDGESCPCCAEVARLTAALELAEHHHEEAAELAEARLEKCDRLMAENERLLTELTTWRADHESIGEQLAEAQRDTERLSWLTADWDRRTTMVSLGWLEAGDAGEERTYRDVIDGERMSNESVSQSEGDK